MKVVLVDNLLMQRENENQQFVLQPHLGLISLVAVLQSQGYDAELYDPKIEIARGKLMIDGGFYKNIAAKILDTKPDVVGFTSLGCNFICTLKIARYIKKTNPRIPIILGGPHATVLHTEILTAYPEFDVIVRNEAEEKIVDVLEGMQSGTLDSIEGITYRRKGKVVFTQGASMIKDLEKLPFPAYHAYPVREEGIRFMRVEAGRGCPFNCTFCSTATFFGRSYRLKSAKKLCRELDFLHQQYGITDFGLTHDLFTVNKAKVFEFCNEVKSRKYTWRCSARMDCVDRELLTAMRQSGCTSIYYGIETGSERMQIISKKKLSLGIFKETLQTTLELDITPTLSFIIGYPEETLEDANATLDMLSDSMFIAGSSPVMLQLHLLTPEPGTALHAQYKDQMEFDNYISDFNFPTLEDDDPVIMKENPAVFMNHHYYRTLLPRHFFVIAASVFESLLTLGNVVTRFLLTHYDRSLAKLNSDIYDWARENNISSITNNIFLVYLVRRFSYQHVLVSLCRYQFEAASLLNVPMVNDGEANRVYSGKDALPENAGAPEFRLLKDIHNYPAIINVLSRNKKPGKKLASERSDFVIHRFEHKKKGSVVESYQLNKFSASIIDSIGDRAIAHADAFCLNYSNYSANTLS